MAKKNSAVDYAVECEYIRSVYVGSLTLTQRYRIICDRLGDFSYNCPDKLVTCVTAIEAYSRSILVNASGSSTDARLAAYHEWQYAKPLDMLKALLEQFAIKQVDFYKEDSKELFKHAVDYRHMLVHEGTYLGHDKFPSMIEACLEILDELAELTGVPKDMRYKGQPSFP